MKPAKKEKREWKRSEIALLKEHYPHRRTSDLAKILCIEVELVYAKCYRLGLRKSDAFLVTGPTGRFLPGGKYSIETQFKPGHKTWNAGIPFESGGRSKETQFKPGQIPSGTMPIGSYRVVKEGKKYTHLECKTSDKSGNSSQRWTAVSRLVWEAVHGPVPKGCIVVFKPGQRTTVLEEITIERLDCITRGEHAIRNHPRKTNAELGRLYQIKGAITRQINRIYQQYQPKETTA